MTASEQSTPVATVTACLIIIGNEILSGRTQDANLAHIARTLNGWGVRLMHARVIPDIEDTIVSTLNECRAAFDYVFTTGGIGPTHDDITADCVAKAFGVPLVEHPEAIAILETYYPKGELTVARRRMARVPQGGDLVPNPVSKAPGFRIGNVFVLAGVPAIMRAQLHETREHISGGLPMVSRTVTAFVGESRVAVQLEELQDRYTDVEIGSYPFWKDGKLGTSLVFRGTDPARLEAGADELKAILRDLGTEPIDGEP
ncbi:competence/damage-inducible protein A [Zavarzinia sp. CC-PAN008]|uniref:competence/damage-inducible protein A n=1 Tax=Zavarzinia sp. CC-PAN008 TaxID=3243332 RepID=UPI003F7484D5